MRDSGFHGFRNGETPAVYTPCAQQAGYRRGNLTLVVRTAGAPGPALPALRQRIEALGVESPVRVTTMRAQAEQTLSRERALAWVASVFAALALGLVAVGLYALLSFLVRSRTREIGVRKVLGADPASVVRWVLASALRMALAGVLLGVPLAYAAGRYAESMLFQVSPGNLAAPFAAGAVLTAVAAAAALPPARRASAIDPVEALRQE